MYIEGRVGSKGELFIPKEIRERLGLKPHMRVLYRIKDGRLIVEPIPVIEDVLKEHKPVRINLKKFHDFRRELSRNAEL